jgi:hypothetical protein
MGRRHRRGRDDDESGAGEPRYRVYRAVPEGTAFETLGAIQTIDQTTLPTSYNQPYTKSNPSQCLNSRERTVSGKGMVRYAASFRLLKRYAFSVAGNVIGGYKAALNNDK